MAILLALLITMVFILPVVVDSNSAIGKVAQDVLLSLILLSGVVEASTNSREFAFISLVALVVITVRWVGWLSPTGLSLPVRDVATLLALVLLAAVVAMKVFGSHTVTKDRISGAIAVYIMAGLVWADAYQLVMLYVPHAFAGISTLEGAVDRSSWVYFSFATLTTVGYGDIVPVAPIARSLSNLEALIGQLYPAIVLARLVSLQVTGGSSGAKES
jgi:Ion channel